MPRAKTPSMDSVDDPLPLDQPGFLYNLHSCQRRAIAGEVARLSPARQSPLKRPTAIARDKPANPVAAATSIPAPHSRGDLGNGEKDSELLSSFWFYEAGYS